MFKNLPQDVGNIIYNFLLFSESHGILFILSKKTTKNISKLNIIIKYNRFLENVEMKKHDKPNSFIINKDDNLEWEKYHLYRWPKPIFDETKNDTKDEYNIGEYVDVKDFVNTWCPAIIKNVKTKYYYINPSVNGGETKEISFKTYDVEFLGWENKFNENVTVEKISRLGKYTLNPKNKFGCLIKNNFKPFWGLLKLSSGKWVMLRISTRMYDEINDKVLIIDNFNNEIEITKDNIEKKLCSVSNGSAFLCNTLKNINPLNKTFYY